MSIQTDLTRIKNAKAAIKAAIEGKGVTVPSGAKLDALAALIESIQAGGGGEGSFIVGTFTPSEDVETIELPGVEGIEYSQKYCLVIVYDPDSGKVTSGHFRIGMDVGYTRVSRYYSSTLNEYSPQAGLNNTIKIYNATFQAGITYIYIFKKEIR